MEPKNIKLFLASFAFLFVFQNALVVAWPIIKPFNIVPTTPKTQTIEEWLGISIHIDNKNVTETETESGTDFLATFFGLCFSIFDKNYTNPKKFMEHLEKYEICEEQVFRILQLMQMDDREQSFGESYTNQAEAKVATQRFNGFGSRRRFYPRYNYNTPLIFVFPTKKSHFRNDVFGRNNRFRFGGYGKSSLINSYSGFPGGNSMNFGKGSYNRNPTHFRRENSLTVVRNGPGGGWHKPASFIGWNKPTPQFGSGQVNNKNIAPSYGWNLPKGTKNTEAKNNPLDGWKVQNRRNGSQRKNKGNEKNNPNMGFVNPNNNKNSRRSDTNQGSAEGEVSSGDKSKSTGSGTKAEFPGFSSHDMNKIGSKEGWKSSSGSSSKTGGGSTSSGNSKSNGSGSKSGGGGWFRGTSGGGRSSGRSGGGGRRG